MTSSRRNKMAAALVFILVAAVVLGGMTWASVSSFQLAKNNVTEKHDRRIGVAMGRMDAYMTGILYTETARDYADYQAFQYKIPVAVLSKNIVDVDASLVIVPSDLAIFGPRLQWIDLYFQVNPDGVLSSPQIDADTDLWSFEKSLTFPDSEQRTRQTWEWLRSVLPDIDLRSRVVEGLRSRRSPYATVGAAGHPLAVTAASRSMSDDPDASSQMSNEFKKRKESLRESQVSYLPQPACIDAEVVQRNVRQYEDMGNAEFTEEAPRDEDDVQIRIDPIVTFWIGPDTSGHRKLAFVRECHADADFFYQAFIGDWDRLKPELLYQISDLFPEADLEPILDADAVDSKSSKIEMTNLPVRLRVAGAPGGASGAAWREVRTTLLTIWVAAAAVLIVVGWGLRNLVALTERRMQFAYAVTHELRTPLTTFRLYSDMLSAGLVPEESKQEYLDTLNVESQRLTSLVEEVLEYARLENQKVRLNPRESDGAALLAVICETLHDRCEANGVQSRTENAVANGQRIFTDVELVHRIAGVLVNNACRHARGKKNATVLVRLADEEGMLHLDVIDSGAGVDRADARTIFKPFRRGHKAAAAAQGGIGLGLALARSWAGLLGGRLELAARHDAQYGGAHFRLTIPRQVSS